MRVVTFRGGPEDGASVCSEQRHLVTLVAAPVDYAQTDEPVSYREQTYTARQDDDGRWWFELDVRA